MLWGMVVRLEFDLMDDVLFCKGLWYVEWYVLSDRLTAVLHTIGAACAGSRSARAKPLHWTSCLKIAEDVAHGLAYIHQVSTLIHGNLKSSNVLLGTGFEACITDYCLSLFADSSFTEDPDSAAYRAPEARNSSGRATSKSDVYAFGVLLLELLTGKHPSQQPFLAPADLQDWVRTMRDDDGSEDNRLEMLTEVASICSATSPEQRPAMWQVLKMIQGIKDSVSMEDNSFTGLS
ncbi:inactive receptor [Vigna angularis]|uniref:Inactive receptor n=1 Tax=Phaseolus angularis TaxID=3914 RepID=A0A8T0L9C3_PHAAN|nr:inactive receptor [Vigna angularis]